MFAITFFIIGLFIGITFAQLRQRKAHRQKERSKFNDETDLKATPDEYLSEVQLLRKRYLEAKWKEMIKNTNPPLNT